ncbi:dethiobiotin synthase [Moraxella cuniculi]
MIETTMQGCYFVSGIDTNIGKTIATGFIAKQLMLAGRRVITQKLIQTGNQDCSEDILTHRKIMGVPLFAEDKARLSMPMILSYPASPHLACRLENRTVDMQYITDCTDRLLAAYEVVLLEGAGGLMVPLIDNGSHDGVLIIDYIAKQQYPVILVTSGRLGSINHTLLSLHALRCYGISVYAVAYNQVDDGDDGLIAADTKQLLQAQLARHHPTAKWWEIPCLS